MRPHLLASALLYPALLVGQAADARTLGWQVRPDSASDVAKLSFVEMKPGWHVTTNEFAGIMYRPDMTGVGEYEASMKVHLFPGGAHPEGFGLIIGGRNLVGADQSYTYFLIRSDGKYLIKNRRGGVTNDMTPWTASEAIKVLPAAPTEGSSALNTLTVRAGDGDVTFLINGTQVAQMPRASLPADGVVGMRINHMLNLHISEFALNRPGTR